MRAYVKFSAHLGTEGRSLFWAHLLNPITLGLLEAGHIQE